MDAEFHEEIASMLRRGRRVAIATVVEATGSTPRKEGARMAVLEDGTTVASVGGGALEALVIQDARALLATGGSAMREYLLQEGDDPQSTGMICGGKVRVHLLVEVPPERLLIFGGGHVGKALAWLAPDLGFAATVLDDRPEFLQIGRFPDRVAVCRTGPDFTGDLPPIDGATYVAIVSRCHRTDLAALRRVASSPAVYVGLIGSRRKVRMVISRLQSEGIPAASLDRVHAPIGLPIGACTPGEIAVSIAGEMIRVRRGLVLPRSTVAAAPLPRPAERHRRVER